MKKIFVVLLLLLTLTVGLVSCGNRDKDNNKDNDDTGTSEGGGNNTGNEGGNNTEGEGGDNTEGEGGGNTNPPAGDGNGNEGDEKPPVDYGDATVILPGDLIDIIVADTKAMENVQGLRDALDELTGKEGRVYNSYAAERDREIVFGYIEDRAISVKAYELLERMEKDAYFDGRFLIYAEDGDIGVAYDENTVSSLSAFTYALEFLLDGATDGKGYMAYSKGIAARDTIDLIAEQEKIDTEYLITKWDELRAVAGDEITDAMQTLYTLYIDSMIDWLANLYAPGKMDVKGGNWAGGFYGAPSGRDTQGFGPDITCTRQVLGLIESTGMLDRIGGNYGLVLPEQMKADIIYMLKSLQDPNGYFYHPQYDKETMEARGDLQRRGRDLAAATTLLSKLGARPTYTTPTGMGGDRIDADGNYVSSGRAPATLCTGTPQAVSAAIAASKVSAVATDDYLSSHAKFAEYLAGRKINEESYSVGNTLSAITSQVRAASSQLGACTDESSPYFGKTLVDMLIDFLDTHIDPTTGMWEATTKFRATNGFMKCISVYNECKRPFPMPSLALTGLFEGLLGDQKSTGNICDVYNIWVGIAGLRSNVTLYSTLSDAEKATLIERIDATFEDKGAFAIINTYNKYVPYRYDDGSFSDNVGSAADTLNGLPAGLGLAEGDTNATSIATAVVGQVYSSFGLTEYKVPLYTESDWMRFCEIIMGLGPVIKYSYLDDNVNETFEDYTPGVFEESEISVFVANGVSDAKIVKENGNNYLEFNKTAKNNSGTLTVKGNRTMNPANTTTVTMRLNVTSANNQRIRFNLLHSNASSALQQVDFRFVGGKLQFIGSSGDVNTGVAIGEWFELKLEYFEGNDEHPLFIRVYVNGTLYGVIDTVKSTAYTAQQVSVVKLIPLYDFLGTILVDDVTIVRDKITHDFTLTPGVPGGETPENPGTGEGGGSDTPTEPEKPAVDSGISESFDSFAEGAFVDGGATTFVDNGVSTAEIVVDGENKYLKFDKTGKNNSGILTVKGDYTKASADTATVTMKLNFTKFTAGNFKVNLTHYNGSSLLQSFLFKADGTHLYYVSDSGDVYIGAEVGEWFELKFVYYQGGENEPYFTRVYAGDKLIGIKTTVDSKAYKAAEIGAVKFVPLYGWLGTVLIDDLTIFRSEVEHDMTVTPEVIPLPTVPEEPDPENPGEGGTTDPENPGTGEGGTTDPENPGTGEGGTTDPENPGTGEGGTTDPENPGTGEGGTTDPENPGTGEGGTTDPENPGTGEGGTADPENPGTGEGGGTETPETPEVPDTDEDTDGANTQIGEGNDSEEGGWTNQKDW